MKVLRYVLKSIGNLYWKLFGGVALCLIWFALGVAAALTVVGAPLAVSFFRIGRFVYKPFGKKVTLVPSAPVVGTLWAATGGVAVGVFSMIFALLSAAVASVFPFSVSINRS